MRYTAQFSGRKVGAIGIFYPITADVEGDEQVHEHRTTILVERRFLCRSRKPLGKWVQSLMSTVFISEQFTTIQGTGVMSGESQYFVRFAGCSVVSCPIRAVCDQPESLNGKHGSHVLIDEIELAALKSSRWLHVTGGEPCDQPGALGSVLIVWGKV